MMPGQSFYVKETLAQIREVLQLAGPVVTLNAYKGVGRPGATAVSGTQPVCFNPNYIIFVR